MTTPKASALSATPLSRPARRGWLRALVLPALLAATAVHAADLLDDVKHRGTLRIGMEGTYPPFNFKDEKGQLAGFDVEIAAALAQKLGVKPEYTTAEWSGLLAGLQANKYDVVVNQVAATEQRRQVFDFSDPYVVSSPQLVVRANETRPMATPADLKGKTIGVGQGSNYADLARKIDGVNVKVYPGSTEYLQDLAAGRIDAALNDSLLIPYLAQKTKLPVKAGAPLGTVETNAIPFRKGNPKFKAALDQALASLKADGSFARISQKWFGRDVSKPPVAQ